MKRRIGLWTGAALLCTALLVSCSGGGSDPFGSSGSGGGGGGGGVPGTGPLLMQVLLGNVAGTYNGVTVTVQPLTPGPPDTVPGGSGSSTVVDMSNSDSIGAQFCPLPLVSYGPQSPSCNFASLWPQYSPMLGWTLSFDMMFNMNLANVNSVTVSYGVSQCALTYLLNLQGLNNTTFQHYVITPSMFVNNPGPACNANATTPVNAVFGVLVLRAGAAVAGDAFYIDNVKWTAY